MRVLVTGSGGQLGGELRRLLSTMGAEAGPMPEVYRGAEADYVGRADLDISDGAAVGSWFAGHAPYDLVVNCTPVGMYSDGPYPINISTIQKEQAVFDMVYGKETPLMAHARARGCRTARGEDMLAGQGAASFETWTGVGGMFDVMRGQL